MKTPRHLPSQEKFKMALRSAAHDEEFKTYLEECGYSKFFIEKVAHDLFLLSQAEEVNCNVVKRFLKRVFRKKPKVRKTVMSYRQKLAQWINDEDVWEFPPQFSLHHLPPLTGSTVGAYLTCYDELAQEVGFSRMHNLMKGNSDQDITTDNLEKIQNKFFEDDSNNERLRTMTAVHNLKSRLFEFVNDSENYALKVLLHIFKMNDFEAILSYEGLLIEALKKLIKNIHFKRSLFHLIDRHLTDENLPKRLDSRILKKIIETLISLGVCERQEFIHIYDKINEVRDNSCFKFRFYELDNQGNEDDDSYEDVTLVAPKDCVPVHWNGHRLVKPGKNGHFQDFSKNLKQHLANENPEEKENRESKLREYIANLDEGRRYALDFARIKVDDMPGAEDSEIWFHYFDHDEMQPDEIGVELIVNGASIVYFLDKDGNLYNRTEGNLLPRNKIMTEEQDGCSNESINNNDLSPTPSRMPFTKAVWSLITTARKDKFNVLKEGLKEATRQSRVDFDFSSIDYVYRDPSCRRWTSEDVIQLLHYYFIKYAHHLLCEPRTYRNTSGNQSRGSARSEFDIRLTEYTSEVTIPTENQSNEEGGKLRTLTIFHDVSGHIRKLSKGKSARPRAIAEAAKHHVKLPPGYTFVRSYAKGTQLAEETRSKKKIRTD